MESSADDRANPACRGDSPPSQTGSAEDSPQDARPAGFTYSAAEIHQALTGLYGTAYPPEELVQRRQREKFFDYLRRVSLIVPEVTGPSFRSGQAGKPAQPDAPGEGMSENPYLKLRSQDPGSALLPPQDQAVEQDAAGEETPTERYIRLADESTNTIE